MCREGAWAELAAEVTFMVEIQSRAPGKKYIQNMLTLISLNIRQTRVGWWSKLVKISKKFNINHQF